MPEISIIVLTFNSIKFIKSCLDSVLAQDYKCLEVIVIDNGSIDGTVTFIKEEYPQLRLIENRNNLGAAKARNQGIEVSKGDWILTLDCDIILEKDFLKKIIEFISASGGSVGSFQPKILNIDKKIIYSCGIHLSWIRRFFDINKGKVNNQEFDTPQYIFGACSAAALYSRQMLEEIKEDTGYFDERFFFLVEDVDVAWRAQRKGWKAVFCPETICYHHGNSSKTDKKLRHYLCFRNRLSLVSKNENLLGKIRLIPVFLMYDFPRLLFFIDARTQNSPFCWQSSVVHERPCVSPSREVFDMS